MTDDRNRAHPARTAHRLALGACLLAAGRVRRAWTGGALLLCLAGLAGCFAGGEEPDPRSVPSVVVLPAFVGITQGQTVTLQVDVDRMPENDGVQGYATNFSEEANRVAISTAPCPAGLGTPSCRLFTITPALDSLPGEYQAIEVRASGTLYPVSAGALYLTILPRTPPSTAARLATDVHVITTDRRLYASGSVGSANTNHGRSGVGFRTVGFNPDIPYVAPASLQGFVPVGNPTDRWLDVATGSTSAVAIRSDGSVWSWGASADGGVGYGGGSVTQITPYQVSGLSGARSVSSFRGDSADRYLVLVDETDADGHRVPRVYALGGVVHALWLSTDGTHTPDQELGDSEDSGAYNVRTRSPRSVPQAISVDGDVTSLTDVRLIAGATSNSGEGWALAVKVDGSVWQFGTLKNYGAHWLPDDGFFAYHGHDEDQYFAGRAMPRAVGGLPAGPGAIVQVATAAIARERDSNGIARSWDPAWGFAVGADGRVYAWTRPDAMAAPVAGIDHVVGIDIGQVPGEAGPRINALRGDGSVWSWRVGTTETPQPVSGLSNVRWLGKGAPDTVIEADCPDGGTVWHRDLRGVIERVGWFGLDTRGGCSVPEQVAYQLTVEGNGEVTTSPYHFQAACRDHCTGSLVRDLPMTLAPVPDLGGDKAWISCTGADREQGDNGLIRFVPRSDTECTVRFLPPYTELLRVELRVEIVGAPGRVGSIPAGISCPNADCVAQFGANTPVRLLTAGDEPSSHFVRWTGDGCNADGSVQTDQSRTCTAVFETVPVVSLTESVVLNVAIEGEGRVHDDATPLRIDCSTGSPDTCSATLALAQPPFEVALVAEPAAGYRFAGFSGHPDCSDARLTMSEGRACTAVFALILPPAIPTALTASATGFSVTLQWAAVPDVETYELSRARSDGSDAVTFADLAANATSYVDNAVSADITYVYVLRARNVAGVSASASVVVTTPVDANWAKVGAADIGVPAAFGQPSLALSADGGNVALAQVDQGTAFDLAQVYTTSVRDANPWRTVGGTPGASLSPAAGTQPSLALDSQGASVIAWTQAGATGNDVRVARYDTHAARWVLLGDALDVDLGSPALDDATQPALQLDAADRPVVAWLQGGGVYVRRWNGSAWAAVGNGGNVTGAGAPVDALRLVLDAAGTPQLVVRRGAGTAAQLFAYRSVGATWVALGGAVNAPVPAVFGSLSFFDAVVEADGALLVVWSEGSVPHNVQARRWRTSAWQVLPYIVGHEDIDAITGLAVARSGQLAQFPTAPVIVMVARVHALPGYNPRVAAGDIYRLDGNTWTFRYDMGTSGPMYGLTLRITGLDTPVAAWLAETGALGSGTLEAFVWLHTP